MTMTDPGAELALRVDEPTAATMVLAGATPEDLLGNAARIANALKGLIERQNLSVSVGGSNKHVEVGGWQAAGAMLGTLGGTPLHAETIWSRRVDRDDAIVYESRCEVRTLGGDVVGVAESLCSSEERNWRGRDEFAIKGMAETRAESRAYRRAIGWVINLAGYSPTPAEEMPAAAAAGKLPDWAQPMRDIAGVANSLTKLLQAAGVNQPAVDANRIGQEIFTLCDETFPFALARLAGLLANAAERAPGELSDEDVVHGVEKPAVDATATEEPAAASDTTTQERAA